VTPEEKTASPEAINKEAQHRLERVIKEVLEVKSIDDRKKEGMIYDMLCRGPIEVRRVVLQGLSALIKNTESQASRARLRNARHRLVTSYPLECIEASIDAFFHFIENDIFPGAAPQIMADYIVGHALNLHPDLIAPLRARMPDVIANHDTPWKAQEYRTVLERFTEFDATFKELEALHANANTPAQKAQAMYDGLIYRVEQADRTQSYQVRNQLTKMALRAVRDLPSDVLEALPAVLLETFRTGTSHAGLTEPMLFTCFERFTVISTETQSLMLEYVSRLDVMYLHESWADYQSKLRLWNLIESLEPMPALIEAMLRRTGTDQYTNLDLKARIKRIPFGLNPGEAWTDRALSDLAAMPETERVAWMAFLAHANTDKAKPSGAWESTAKTLIADIPDFTARASAWLALVGKPRTHVLISNNERFDPWNANIVRGLAWAVALVPATDDIARALTHLVETSLKKAPGVGPRSPKLATAGTVGLGRLNTNFAVGQLARLKARVTFKTTLKEIEKALEESARRAGITKEDLEEIAVPTYGLGLDGTRIEQLGDVTATLRVSGNDVLLEWTDAKGKSLKNPPASVKKEFADDLKELKTALKDIEGMISAQSVRLDKLNLARKTWSFQAWQERYLEHPLVGTIARRLIWTVDGVTVAWNAQKNALQTVLGEPVSPSTDAAVALWHPINADQLEVVAWRTWLETHNITQPWKQAFREVYILTDAERRTNTYSNRFAAHVIKQHQFAQLAAFRGWKNKLRLMVDDSYPPATLELPQWGLRAEYWIEGIGDNYGVDTNDTGTYLRLVTDQVRFYAIAAAENYAHASGGGYGTSHRFPIAADPIPLEDVPPIVLSEAMRDVDLFVGVASVGNDPTWNDGGPGGRFRAYWESYSFGELTETAQTRKAVLETLVPRLKIKDRAWLEGKFLHVRGDIRTYKIHLGSGNILMLPNDQYLCIVPNASLRSTENASSAFLPFEGDGTLAVILSKAFLLAADTKITDATITRQIKP
jgi:Domain of unknown function (DUF4132)